MPKRLRQADPRWSKVTIGFGPGSIGRKGCVLVSLCEAVRMLRAVEMLPPHLNAAARQAKAFLGELVIWDAIRRVVGLDIQGPRTGEDMLPVIKSTLRDKGCCLLHVDHRNDERGDHWILAHTLTDVGDFVCSDSATGDDVIIGKDTLRGATTWGSEPKVYTVRVVRPIFPLT